MAKIGLKNAYYSVATEAADGTLTYAGATKPGKMISASFEPATSDATLYADDSIAERDSSVNGGTLTVGIDRYDAETASALLGHDVTEEGIETSNEEDTAPKVGFAYIVPLLTDNQRTYRVSFYPCVVFQEPSESADTKGESTEFGTYELEGTVMPDANGDYRKRQTFTTVAAADAWIASLLAAPTDQSTGD